MLGRVAAGSQETETGEEETRWRGFAGQVHRIRHPREVGIQVRTQRVIKQSGRRQNYVCSI